MVAQKAKFQLPPGIVLSRTDYEAKGRYIACDKIRFKDGSPEKLGGWEQWNTPGDELPFTCRSMLCWQDYSYQQWHAFGTYHRLYVFDGVKVRTNITPIVSTGTLANPFTTTSGSPTVTVSFTSHGLVPTQAIYFSGASAVGGITISGWYDIVTTPTPNSFTITHTSNASSSAGPGGGASVAYQIELAPGRQTATTGGGWGIGTWGSGTWNDVRSSAGGFVSYPRYWSLDTYGQYLYALPSEGTLYRWDANISARAVAVANAPSTANYMFVTSERMPFMLGTNGDQMRVQWPDQDDNTIWTAGPNNTANSRRLQTGSRLVCGARMAQRTNCIWSDTAFYLAQYTGTNVVYTTPLIAVNCGIVGPAAFAVVDGIPYWMTPTDFMMYAGGSVQPMPNSQDVNPIFKTLDAVQAQKVQCFYHPDFREIWWHYPSEGASEPDSYVIYSLEQQCWYNGTMGRSCAGIRTLSGHNTPLMVTPSGVIYEHESTLNDDGLPLDWTLTTGYFDLSDGNVSMNIDGYFPDMKRHVGNIDITWESKEYPADTAALHTTTEVIAEGQDIVDIRHFGRQSKFTLSQTDVLDGDFRLGDQRIEAAQSGKRRGS